MSAFLIATTVLVAVALYCWIAVRINGGLHWTPFLIATGGILAFVYIGTGLIAIGWTGRPFKELEAAHGLALYLHTTALLFLFLAGAAAAARFRSAPPRMPELNHPVFVAAVRIGMGGLGGVAALVFGLYLSKLNTIPIIAVGAALLGGGDADGTVLRSLATANFQGHYWRYNTFMAFVLPVVSWYFLCRSARPGGGARGDRLFFWIFFGLSAFAAVVSLQKAPILIYGVFTYLVHLTARGSRLSFGRLAVTGGILVALLPILYIVFMGQQGVGAGRALLLAFNRIFAGQAYPALMYFEVFPRHHDFLLGRGFPNPGGLMGFTPVPPSYLVWAHFFPAYDAQGIHGTANTIFFMEWYANFGSLGMYAVTPIAGLLVMLATRALEAVPSADLSIPLSALIGREFLKLSMTDFSQVMVNFPIAVILLCITAVLIFAVVVAGAMRHPMAANGAWA